MFKKKLLKKLISIFSVFLLFVSVFVAQERKVVASDTQPITRTYEDTFTGSGKGRNFYVVLGNHDEKTFIDFSIEVKEHETGTVIDRLGPYTLDSDEAYYYKENFSYTYIISSDKIYNKDEIYDYIITVNSNYDHVFEMTRSRTFVANVCLERLEIAKEWDDAENSENRPTLEDFASKIRINGSQPNEVVIDTREGHNTDSDKYEYVAYGGFSIAEDVEINEAIVDDYVCTNRENPKQFYDGEHYDVDFSVNVSRAKLKNKNGVAYFDLKLVKTDVEENPLEGAEFTITNISEKTVTIDGEEIKSKGTYKVKSDKGGLVEVKDISSNGEYEIEETEAPKGYKKYEEVIKFNYNNAEETEEGKNLLLDLGQIVNEEAGELISVNVSKKWDDNDDEQGFRPASIEVKLLADGKETGDVLVLNESNKWQGVFEDLEKYDGENEIVYTVKEEKVEGYEEPTVTGDAKEGFVITNKVLSDEGGDDKPVPEPDPDPKPEPDPDPDPKIKPTPPAPYTVPKTGVE